MARRPRFRLIPTTCRRCGTALYTGSRSLYGADDLKARYHRICDACMSPAEKDEMLRAMGPRVAGFLAAR